MQEQNVASWKGFMKVQKESRKYSKPNNGKLEGRERKENAMMDGIETKRSIAAKKEKGRLEKEIERQIEVVEKKMR